MPEWPAAPPPAGSWPGPPRTAWMVNRRTLRSLGGRLVPGRPGRRSPGNDRTNEAAGSHPVRVSGPSRPDVSLRPHIDDGRSGDEEGGSLDAGPVDGAGARIAADRLRSLRELTATHPGDPGVLISLLLHLVTLEPGQAVYLSARQLHAYLGGIAVEVMAASDNVLRAGLTEKHVDAAEVLRIVDMATLDSPRLEPVSLAPGLIAWRPGVPDFVLKRARLGDPRDCAAHDEREERERDERLERAESVLVESEYPTVLVATSGRVRVERVGAELSEVASVGRGQSLYVSAGEPIEISGLGEVFLATVGEGWSSVSQPSSEG